ncbi:MAG: 4Fe-4S dicluster domain-containing protein [Myxococcota bacterium]|nr:4Fe-4S dicluster domain-containing protein [Myxococcota bacterium]
MNYGFVIDTRSCIGCHACSTACKSENQVPLGTYRTWVKYTETGVYPDAKRHFQVTRCNHCANPPCVRICPVTAMYQRTDGIVEFDSDVCIGCKACMQACPYDAIYVDPDSGTAAKCHYCGHRVESGLEPSCVVVCPTHSIIAGDMDDPSSEISKVLAKNAVTVRKPEQGTAPKLFYVEGHDASMHPTAGQRHPDQMIWADSLDENGQHAGNPYDQENHAQVHLDLPSFDDVVGGRTHSNGTPIRIPQAQGQPLNGPIQASPGHSPAEHMVQTAYNAQHKVPWHWQVPAYLVTKGIGAGVFGVLALSVLAGAQVSNQVAALGGIVGVVMLLVTTVLLVADLERPERFLRIILRPQMKSWLTRGAFILIAFSNVAAVWAGWELAAWMDWAPLPDPARMALAAVSLPLALGGAVYTAFLFAQCEGRDLWQSPLLPVHLVVQAAMMGGAGLSLIGMLTDIGAVAAIAHWTFAIAVIVDLMVILGAEFGMAHASEVAAVAAHKITHGKYKNLFWGGAIVLGHVIPAALLLLGNPIAAGAAALAAIVGLYAYEHAFVMAPQEVPNS